MNDFDSTRYKRNPQGYLVPIEMIKPVDLLRDELVTKLVNNAKTLSGILAKYRGEAFSEIANFVDLSAKEYGAALGGVKGNVTLMSFDGRFKIVRQYQETITFDERLQAAKALVDSCITRWAKDSNAELRALVNDAFQVDKEGRINTQRVLSLRRLDIDDEEWKQAMKAIGDSVQVASSKTYLRFYERVGDSDKWDVISLDFANV
jgi:hypothetical protein